jgi:hypothetical protein
MTKQFPDVHAPRGAPMGRPSHGDPTTEPAELFKVTLVDGCYDDGGAYWGAPDNLWCLRTSEAEHFLRGTPMGVLEQVKRLWPDICLKDTTAAFEAQVDIVTQHYIIAAIWADCEEGTNPRCTAGEALRARQVCRRFILQCEAAGGLFSKAVERFDEGYGAHPDSGSAEAAFGHDFWLMRQGHGTGFWDRKELGQELRNKLTEQAKLFGENHRHYQSRGWWYFNED